MPVPTITLHNRPFLPSPFQIGKPSWEPTPIRIRALSSRPKSQKIHQITRCHEDGIPVDDVKLLAKFKSRHNHIRVLEVSRRADHPFAGSRLLLLDGPGNIHSIHFVLKLLTETYFDVFATLPPIIPPGPIAILGFGAGSAARLILELYSDRVVHGWELDPCVIEVGRKYFGLSKLEHRHKDRLFIYFDDALKATSKTGFSGILIDLFSRGSVLPELEDPNTWMNLKKLLKKNGRFMVNVGGSCVESENPRKDGRMVMEDTLRAMKRVFGDELYVLSLGNREDDSSIALTGSFPDLDLWRKKLHRDLGCYVDMWDPYRGCDPE